MISLPLGNITELCEHLPTLEKNIIHLWKYIDRFNTYGTKSCYCLQHTVPCCHHVRTKPVLEGAKVKENIYINNQTPSICKGHRLS